MKRWRRILFNGLAVLSLALFAATLALWARSFLPSSIRARVVDGSLVLVGVDSGGAFTDDLCGGGEGSRRAMAALLKHAAARHDWLGFTLAQGKVQGSSAETFFWNGPFGVRYGVVVVPLVRCRKKKKKKKKKKKERSRKRK